MLGACVYGSKNEIAVGKGKGFSIGNVMCIFIAKEKEPRKI